MTVCKVCGSATTLIGSKRGKINQLHFYRCRSCQFAFVTDPGLTTSPFAQKSTTAGSGRPYVDYVFDSGHPDTTIRVYEWQGILENICKLISLRAGQSTVI